MMLRSLLAGKELDANQYCRCGSVKCDSTCSVKFLFTYVCRRKSLASRLIKNNYIWVDCFIIYETCASPSLRMKQFYTGV